MNRVIRSAADSFASRAGRNNVLPKEHQNSSSCLHVNKAVNVTKALRTGNIKTILFILRTIDTEGSKRVSTGGATYILKPETLVLTHVTLAFQPRIAEPSQSIPTLTLNCTTTTMLELTVFDSTNKGTLRPDKEPLELIGDKFVPIKLPHFDWEIHLLENASPNDPITLFTIYYTPKIIYMIFENTKNNARRPRNELLPRARANEWYPTCRGEIYLYFTIRIYIILVILNKISNY